MLVLLRSFNVPTPQVNVVVAGEVVDYYWPAQRLVLEVDPFFTHKTRARFEADRRKDIKLQLAGCRVIRMTPERIRDEPGVVASQILAFLRTAA